ncbi:iron chaperone [Paenibacillus sp. strain BS8-2]
MQEKKAAFASIDEYIAAAAPDVREILQTLRGVIREAAPEAKEKISYAMPTFDYQGNIIHFAAFKNHIGVYPAPSGIEAFAEETKPYNKAKGTLQFPLNQPLPYELIARIVQYRVASNEEKARSKSSVKPDKAAKAPKDAKASKKSMTSAAQPE